jgi:hypothetical protein
MFMLFSPLLGSLDADFFLPRVGLLRVFLHALTHAYPNREHYARIGTIVISNIIPIGLVFSKRRGYDGRESR